MPGCSLLEFIDIFFADKICFEEKSFNELID